MTTCTHCGRDDEPAPPTLTARWCHRHQEGSCLACPPDRPYRKVWLITMGQTRIQLCQKHMTSLRKMTA